MNQTETFNKALTDIIDDGKGGTTTLYVFGVKQPNGDVKQILSVVGVVCMEIVPPVRGVDLLRAGCETTNILPILQSLQSFNFPATETLGLENDSPTEGN